MLFDGAEAFLRRRERFFDGYTYGLAGTPTHLALVRRLARLEGARRCVLASSGLSAINLVNHAVLRAGDHVLCCSSAYGPTRESVKLIMGRFGVETEFFDPDEGARIARRFRPSTRLLWLEVPGSISMRMADTRAIAAAAAEAGVLVAMDNTWATPCGFKPLEHGITFSVQALTKFMAGHSDVLMGCVCVNDEAWFRDLKTTANLLGINVSPDDCALVARGMDTLELRMERHSANTIAITRWLQQHARVRAVYCPALPRDPGNALWRRDFATAGSLCTIALQAGGLAQSARFLDSLHAFKIGASWGGVHSLAAIYPPDGAGSDYLIRLHFGIEPTRELIEDLSQALG